MKQFTMTSENKTLLESSVRHDHLFSNNCRIGNQYLRPDSVIEYDWRKGILSSKDFESILKVKESILKVKLQKIINDQG